MQGCQAATAEIDVKRTLRIATAAVAAGGGEIPQSRVGAAPKIVFNLPTQAPCHSSGAPALHMPSQIRSRWARKVGLSLGAPARKREMVKVGLSANPA